MIYILYGEDSYRSRAKLREIAAEYRKKIKGVLDLHRFDAETDDAASFIKETKSISLFQQKKLVIVERFSRAGEKFLKQMKANAEEWQADSNTIVVLWDDAGESAAQKFVKALEPFAAKVQHFGPMSIAEAKKWFDTWLKAQGLALAPSVTAELTDKFHADTWQLTNEAGKIGLGGEPALTKESAERKIFSLTDYFLVNSIQALRALLALRQASTNEQYIFSAIVNHVRLLLLMSDGKEARLEENIHPFVLQKARAKARGLEPSRIRGAYERLFDEDAKIKIGLSDPYSSLVNLILL
ncbi:MAG: hypothetical protein HYT40_01635 [Candidatus Sungbacteria bacterium]|uniref:DNA polymerase III delta N-terminal domain-containing protein n=1 Tax=Candidatus Sungiibacteriota bacterium TaxID=2750080 RepID=A0A931SBF3_9BACT|nr:hypothetical protein [Candidatus Sungbacteria bacterium]